jgi:lipopolysaccharide/colanic/teichoic acid biosynthesis glycosyltransferase
MPAHFYRRIGKRGLDLALVGLSLPLVLPLLALVGLLVWYRLGSPILFRQRRPGRHGRPFTLLKFRSMTSVHDRHGQLLPDAARLTRFGRWLRATSLDELPELVNVVRGEMSLVGPRPLLMEYLDRYTSWQNRRHEVRPGITGSAQVEGRNAIGWNEKFSWDVAYVDRCSFLLDCSILLRTAATVVSRRGVNPRGTATMPRFLG